MFDDSTYIHIPFRKLHREYRDQPLWLERMDPNIRPEQEQVDNVQIKEVLKFMFNTSSDNIFKKFQ